MNDQPEDRADLLSGNLALLYRHQVRELEEFAMFVVSPEGRIATWNRGVERTFGYSEQEWLSQKATIIFTEEDRVAGVPEEEMRLAAAEGRSSDIRWHQRKDGSHIYLTGVMRALRDDRGALIGFSKICLDDTARKHLEDALTQSNTDLQQFAYIASHDLQEPLRTLSTFSTLLKQRYAGKLDAQADKMLDFLTDAATRMSTLIRDLLALSRFANEESRIMSVRLDEDLETAISLLRTTVEETGAVITHDALPELELDRNQMVRLFQNLLSNSLKFRKKDETPRVHVSAERKDNAWKICVVDNGIGLPPDAANRIFEPFKRLNNPSEYPGSGLGLAACKRIVESYGGRIGAESRPAGGSTFWFTIPVRDSR